MEPKEIVMSGLQARKEVRSAEAKAGAYRAAAAAEKDARFHERLRHKNDAARWAEEKSQMEKTIMEQRHTICKLSRQHEIRDRQEEDRRQRSVLAAVMKCFAVFTLLVSARDLGWVTPWFANCLVIATAVYSICSAVVAFAARKR